MEIIVVSFVENDTEIAGEIFEIHDVVVNDFKNNKQLRFNVCSTFERKERDENADLVDKEVQQDNGEEIFENVQITSIQPIVKSKICEKCRAKFPDGFDDHQTWYICPRCNFTSISCNEEVENGKITVKEKNNLLSIIMFDESISFSEIFGCEYENFTATNYRSSQWEVFCEKGVRFSQVIHNTFICSHFGKKQVGFSGRQII